MRDFLPAEKAHRDRLLSTIKATYREHGFDEIETPVVEDSSRLNSGLGGDNEKLAFGILKRGLGEEDFTIRRGDRIAQGVIAAAPQWPLVEVDDLDATDRGAGGFGSTGV